MRWASGAAWTWARRLSRAREARVGVPAIRAAVHERRGAAPPHPWKERQYFQEHRLPRNTGTPNEPPEPRPEPPRAPQWDTGGGALREERTLPLCAALPAPGHAKTRLPLEPGGQLCRYLRHLRLRGQANRRSRSSGRQIRPDSRGNGTGVSAISGAKPRVFGGFRGGEAIWPESPVKGHRGSRVFRPELAAPERN